MFAEIVVRISIHNAVVLCARRSLALFAALSCLLLLGCGGVRMPITTEQYPEQEFGNPKSPPASDITGSDEASLTGPAPNPDRTNPFQLFEPQSDGRKGEILTLKGFVERDDLRAVIAFGDEIRVVSEDDSIGDIKIIHLRPPQMVYEENGIQHRLTL